MTVHCDDDPDRRRDNKDEDPDEGWEDPEDDVHAQQKNTCD
jgi:hypothetical protein